MGFELSMTYQCTGLLFSCRGGQRGRVQSGVPRLYAVGGGDQTKGGSEWSIRARRARGKIRRPRGSKNSRVGMSMREIGVEARNRAGRMV